jgi:NADH:ubiquinone oxidoreductase subunit 2 (subunit N)
MFEISTIIILLSVIGSFYYLRFIKILFFEKKIKYDGFIVDNAYNEVVYVLAAFSLFVIIFGFIDPSLFLLFSYKISLGLMFV